MLRRVSLMTSRANELANPIGQYGEPEPPQQPKLRELLLQQAGTPRVAYMPQHVYIFTPCREPWPAASINARLGKVPVVVGGKHVMLPASTWLDQNRPVESCWLLWALACRSSSCCRPDCQIYSAIIHLHNINTVPAHTCPPTFGSLGSQATLPDDCGARVTS